jgi:tetratricopeptide (TPR) repeat protein
MRYGFFIIFVLCFLFNFSCASLHKTKGPSERVHDEASVSVAAERSRNLPAADTRAQCIENIAILENYLSNNPDWKNEAWVFRAEAYKEIGNTDPGMAVELYNKGVSSSRNHQHISAISFYESATELDPFFPWPANNLAWELATSPDKTIRDGSRAIEYSKLAIANIKTPVADFYGTLAAALAADAQYEKAIAICNLAQEIRPTEMRKQMLAQFKLGKPYIDYADPPKKEDSISSEGYGRTKWGMSKIRIMILYPAVEVSSNDLLILEGENVAGLNASVAFHFLHDMLYKASVAFNQKAFGQEKNKLLQKHLLNSHGTPDEGLVDGDSRKTLQWVSNETLIEYTFDKERRTADIVYTGKKFDTLFKKGKKN